MAVTVSIYHCLLLPIEEAASVTKVVNGTGSIYGDGELVLITGFDRLLGRCTDPLVTALLECEAVSCYFFDILVGIYIQFDGVERLSKACILVALVFHRYLEGEAACGSLEVLELRIEVYDLNAAGT